MRSASSSGSTSGSGGRMGDTGLGGAGDTAGGAGGGAGDRVTTAGHTTSKIFRGGRGAGALDFGGGGVTFRHALGQR